MPFHRHLSHPKYRPDIDGLRAIAVLPVVAFHAFPNWLHGGFAGVDVFFVISGFLISSIIFDNLSKGTFSFAEFYIRRVNRIFPALLLVLLSSYAFGWFALLADEYKQLGTHILAGAGFCSNIILMTEVGYFDNAAEIKPLLHLWSLGIEEQFYIVWPLFIYFLTKKKTNVLMFIVFVAVLSFYFNIRGIQKNATVAFFSPKTRFWELLCGSILAWVTMYRKDSFAFIKAKLENWQIDEKRLFNALSFLGLLILGLGFCGIHKDLRFPGGWAIIPVLGAILIIIAGPQAWVNRNLLSNPVTVWFGLISYPLYLWHWPILSFLKIVEVDGSQNRITAGAVLVAILLSWLTYKLIEKPVRVDGRSRSSAAVLVLLMVVMGGIGFATFSRDGFSFRVQKFADITRAAEDWQYPGALKPYPFKDKIFLSEDSDVDNITLFVGDSNIEQYYVRIDELIKTKPKNTNSIIFATSGGCLPIPASPYDQIQHCGGLMEDAGQLAAQNPKIVNVVIGGLWNQYLGDGAALVGKFGYGSDLYALSLSRLSTYIKDLKKLNKTVFLVLNIPFGKEFSPKFLVQRRLVDFPNILSIRPGGLPRKQLAEKYGMIEDDLSRLAEESGAISIRPLDYVCDDLFCSSVDRNGLPMYRDQGHLRPSFVRDNAKFLDVTVNAAGR